jgi:hypothetical protein
MAPSAKVTPDHPVFDPAQTAGAPADGSKPRFGTAYRLNAKNVTPDHPVYDPSLTAGAAAPTKPRFGTPYYGAIQTRARDLGGEAVRF